MRTAPAKQEAAFEKRAKLLDEMVVRAKVRRARALQLGNEREAIGAKRTIDESRHSARRLRAMIDEMSELA